MPPGGGDDGPIGAGVEVIVGLLVGGLMSAFLLPIAINELGAVDTSTWGANAVELWSLLQVAIVLAVFLFFVALALDRGGVSG